MSVIVSVGSASSASTPKPLSLSPPPSGAAGQGKACWRESLSDAITDPRELAEFLQLDPGRNPAGEQAMAQFPLKVPRAFANRMEKGNWNDPLLRQVWPDTAEQRREAGFVADPLRERHYNPRPGLLHKYPGRVLLIAAPHCAIHCRYCFRREFDYDGNAPPRAQWQQAFDYIRADASIEEVILSGGDPLALGDNQLRWLLGSIREIAHVTTIRIHTRLPVVIPARVTRELLAMLGERRRRIVLVIHCNHAREIDGEVAAALAALSRAGVSLLNQSVLLRRVNDDAGILSELSKRLFAENVLPYYLHLPDRVAGTGHFAVKRKRAKAIISAMRASLPGYLVPRLVREAPGESSKTVVM